MIHLGERECSIQRRNQKIIEEAPSPLLDDETRRAMGAQAVQMARAVDYDSAGTVEFVAANDRSFHFLEMNTRLQVEHPVTELVTGIDLVEEMIRIAAGRSSGSGSRTCGSRAGPLNAVSMRKIPTRGFLPSTGRLSGYRPPAERHEAAVTVRNDSGVYEGAEVPVHYDPLLAKLVVHASDRKTATEEMAAALDRFHIRGVSHNLAFLSAVMDRPRWISGKLSTAFIAEEFPDGFTGISPDGPSRERLVAVAAVIDCIEQRRQRRTSGQISAGTAGVAGERHVRLGEEWHAVEILEEGAATSGFGSTDNPEGIWRRSPAGSRGSPSSRAASMTPGW